MMYSENPVSSRHTERTIPLYGPLLVMQPQILHNILSDPVGEHTRDLGHGPPFTVPKVTWLTVCYNQLITKWIMM